MKKAIIIGCPGAGKSTFARKLRDKTGLPLFYLDMIWHKPDKTHISEEKFDEKLNEVLQKEEWIIDGNYSRTLEIRMRECDTIFLFDLPLEVCVEGAEARIGKERVDMPWQAMEMDEDFRQWILDFPKNEMQKVIRLVEKYKNEKQVIIFKSREEADAYIVKLSKQKNVFIEGIQGMGKSTLINRIYSAIPEFRICREGDFSPIDLAWCTWMSKEEYESVLGRYDVIRDEIVKNTVEENGHFIITYTKIITDIPGFHKDLEQYEIYNGRRTFEELKAIVFTRFRNFIENGYLFECSFFQNIMEDLILFHELTDDEIVGFYRELYDVMDKENFRLLYLYSDKLEETIEIIKKERSDNQGNEMWYPLMLEYLVNSPYGKKHGYSGFEDLIEHFKHRQELEMRIIREVVRENAVILTAKEWRMAEVITGIK